MIPYPGIYPDEVLFTDPLYLYSPRLFTIGMFHRRVPLMLLSYLGTLKTLIYVPILAVFHANVWSLRLPMVLVGALTILIFFSLAKRAAGTLIAIAAAFLLATDPSFLLTNTVDWGPVALEHILLVTGCFFLLGFAQGQGRNRLFLGFFLFGVAFWNKAIFVWALAGLFSGAVTVFWPEIRRLLRPATAGIACGGFLLGALPLLVFNHRSHGSTANQNVHIDTNHLSEKFGALNRTVDGSALFGFMSALEYAPDPKTARTLRGRAAVWLADHTGAHRRDGMWYAGGLSLLLVPWWWRIRAARFSLVFMAVAWMAMALTREAGGAAHHAVLLWPFPQLFVAAALCGLPWPRIGLGAAAVLAVINLLVVNQHMADFERYGTAGNFSDAVFGLSKQFSGHTTVMLFDWGIVDQLAFLHKGGLDLVNGSPPFSNDSPSPEDQKSIDWMFSNENAFLVTRVPGQENYPAIRARMDQAGAAAGLHRRIIKVIPDSNGRPNYEIFRFEK